MEIIHNFSYNDFIKTASTLSFDKEKIVKSRVKDIKWNNIEKMIYNSGYPNVVGTFVVKERKILFLLKKRLKKFILSFISGYVDIPGFGRCKNKDIIESPNNAMLGEMREELDIRGDLQINNLHSSHKLLTKTNKFNILSYFIEYDDVSVSYGRKDYKLDNYLVKNIQDLQLEPISISDKITFIPSLPNREFIYGFVWIDIDEMYKLSYDEQLCGFMGYAYRDIYYNELVKFVNEKGK